MNRNANTLFSEVADVKIQRSRFPRNHRHLTAFNSGKLVPIFLEQNVLPGDTISLDTEVFIRMSTPLHPVFDNSYLDIYYFFVPNRLIMDEWKEFMGENTRSYWDDSMPEIKLPHVYFMGQQVGYEQDSPYYCNYFNTVADYMRIPVLGPDVGNGATIPQQASSVKNWFSTSALPFRAYALIWNEWFRGESYYRPLQIDKGSSDTVALWFDNNYFSSASTGGALCPVAKFHDYFTSALPEPQRGPDVYLPLGEFAPVTSRDIENPVPSDPVMLRWMSGNNIANGSTVSIRTPTGTTGPLGYLNADAGSLTSPSALDNLYFTNLWANLSDATAATINDLRLAFALQRFYETDARGGTRYIEMIKAHFGVTSPDARLQRPEYLGGKRIRINMQQVLQTSSTDSVSPQGNTAAFSLTADSSSSFTMSATEHGVILGLACVRTQQTYQYGLGTHWSRRNRTDFYFPTFAHLGEQPIYNKEIFLQGSDEDDEVFGYKEAWAEDRYQPSGVSSVFRSNHPQTLDSWHYAERLDSLPTLSEDFISQSSTVIDRTLAVSSELSPQFTADFGFKCNYVRPMPVHSIPGMRNHF